MKKTIHALLVSVIAAACFTFPVSSQAADLSIGAACWYAWWDLNPKTDDPPDTAAAPMYGPMISFSFARNWSLSAVFLYGYYELDYPVGTEKLYRVDSDLALNYNINRVVKVFAGAKIMGYPWKLNIPGGDTEGVHFSAGPAAGVGLTVPLGENIFLLANVSGLYFRGRNTMESSTGPDIETLLFGYGTNSTLAMAYYITSASMTLSLGFRYQYFYMEHDNEETFEYRANSHFYGIIFSAVYSFGL